MKTRWIVQVRKDGRWRTINVPTSDRAAAYDILKVQRKLLGKSNVRIRKVKTSDLDIVVAARQNNR